MQHKYQIINLSKLVVNSENYRFEPVANEDEALKTMLNAHHDKIKQLLVDIIKYGLNPADPLMVHDIGGKFVALEGNRRLTALKIISNVDILKRIDFKYYTEYSSLLNSTNKNSAMNLNDIPCIIFDEPKNSDRWVALKHTGSNGGKGTLPWGTSEKRIFQNRTSQSTSTANILVSLADYIKNSPYYNTATKENVDKIKITNLERLLFDPQVRGAIGIDIIKGKLYKLYPDEEIAKSLTKVISDLSNKSFKVSKIYTKDLRLTYTSTFDDTILPDINKKLDKPIDINIPISDINVNPIIPDGPEQITLLTNDIGFTNNTNAPLHNTTHIDNDNEEIDNNSSSPQNSQENSKDNIINNPKENKNRTRDIPDINSRKTLIPSRTQIRINNPRINQIYKELKKLDIDIYTNAVSVLFRVFIETSIDEYIEKNTLTSVNSDAKLNKKVQAGLEDLRSKKLISRDHIKPVNVSISDKDSILSINTFNSYVHNKHMFPDSMQLKNSWNQLESFLITVLNNC